MKLKTKFSFFRSVPSFIMGHSISVVMLCICLYGITYFEELFHFIQNFHLRAFNIDTLLKISIFLILSLKSLNFLTSIMKKKLLSSHLDKGVAYSIILLIKYVCWIVIAWVALSILGVQMKNFAIILGAFSVGIGFGLQTVVNNFISGILILFERPIKIGDWVIVKGEEGIVKNINIRSTELISFDNTSILIPNADILSNDLENMTRGNLSGRVVIKIGVSYQADLQKVKNILLDCANSVEGVSKAVKPYVLLMDFGDSSVQFELRAIVDDVMNKIFIRSELLFSIWNAFQTEGIEIPFPQRVVHLSNKG